MSEFVSLRKKILENKFSYLNPMQKKAVFCVNGPLLILAGAGSGKTTVIINRIAYMIKYGNAYESETESTVIGESELSLLRRMYENDSTLSAEEISYCDDIIAENKIKPWNILAITFTNKAANELKVRLEKMLGQDGGEVNAGTFHSACVRILRRDIEKIGYKSNFTIYDTDDGKRVIKECLNELNLEEKRFPAKQILSEISRAKDSFKSPEDMVNESGGEYYLQQVGKVYELYQKKLFSANAVDFDDIILLTVKLFEKDKETLEYYRKRYRYIMVDEYQDTNTAQFKLVNLLAGGHRNLCVVGDDDQSIYKFRGATIENILNFEKHFVSAKIIRLEQNYRSTQNILDAANSIISHNTERKGKNLWTSAGAGEKIVQYRCDNDRGESQFVTDRILDHTAEGGKYGDFAILYRTNSQSAEFEHSFVKSGIPYRIIGGNRFYDRMEIKDLIAYLCVMNNPEDELRLERIINQPKRGIGEASVKAAREIADTLGQSLFETICRADEYIPLKRSAAAMKAFGKMMNYLRDFAECTASLGDLMAEVIEQSGYDVYLKSLGVEGAARIDNVQELVNIMTKFGDENPEAMLSDYLEEVSLLSDIDNYDADADTVVLMTIHSAKGLEFDNVFLVGMEEGLFPSFMSIDTRSELEEERRLAYVGVTRARKKLYLTSCAGRMMYGKTQRNRISRFANEIPDEYKEIIDNCYNDNSFSDSDGFGFDIPDFSFSTPKSSTQNSGGVGGGSSFAPKEKPKSAALDFSVGDTVVHRAFGEGLVVSMTPMSGDTLVEVAFNKVGTKKIMANFAKLKKK